MLVVLSRRGLGGAALACLLLLACGARLARAGRGNGLPAARLPDAAIWRVSTAAPDVAITFDDGPDPIFTPSMLAELRRHHAVGTFFVLGIQAERYPAVLRAEAAEGSAVCNHGYAHKLLRGKADAVVAGEVAHAQTILDRAGVPRCDLFRFPYFASDAAARSTVTRLGYRIVGANVDTKDWRRPSPASMAAQVLGRIQRGDIILLHDGGGPRLRSVQALGLILDGLRQRGLGAVTVGQLLATSDDHRPPVGEGA